MINETQCIELILDQFPDFKPVWNKHLEFWEGEPSGISNDISAFSIFIGDNLKSFDENKKINTFKLVETLMTEGNNDVKDAVATCFLDSFVNTVNNDKTLAPKYVKLLGKNSKIYCCAWSKFIGVSIPGL